MGRGSKRKKRITSASPETTQCHRKTIKDESNVCGMHDENSLSLEDVEGAAASTRFDDSDNDAPEDRVEKITDETAKIGQILKSTFASKKKKKKRRSKISVEQCISDYAEPCYDVLRAIANRLFWEKALFKFKLINRECCRIADQRMAYLRRQGCREIFRVKEWANKTSLMGVNAVDQTHFYNGSEKRLSRISRTVQRVAESMESFVENCESAEYDGLRLSSLGWYCEMDTSQGLVGKRCPPTVRKRLLTAISKFPMTTTYEYSPLLMAPSEFVTVCTTRASLISSLDLGSIEVKPSLCLGDLFQYLTCLRRLIWHRATNDFLLNLPNPSEMREMSVSLQRGCFENLWRFSHVERLHTGFVVPHKATRFDLDILLKRNQALWDKQIVSQDEDAEVEGYLIEQFKHIKQIGFWNCPEKVFALLATKEIVLDTLQFGQLDEGLSRLCSLDSLMQALFLFNQPKYDASELNVKHLKLYLHSMPVVTLDYYMPQMMKGLSECMGGLKSLDVLVNCKFSADMPGSWLLEKRRKNRKLPTLADSLTHFSFTIDGFCLLDDLECWLPSSIESISLCMTCPLEKSCEFMTSLLNFIESLADINAFPELRELHIQVWGIRCAESLLNCVAKWLKDIRRLSIICMPLGEDRNALISLLSHVTDTCTRLEELSLSLPMVKGLIRTSEFNEMLESDWKGAMSKLAEDIGVTDKCLFTVNSLPRLCKKSADYFVMKPHWPGIKEQLASEKEQDEKADQSRSRLSEKSSRMGSEDGSEDDSFIDDGDEHHTSSGDDLSDLDGKLEKETVRHEKRWQRRRISSEAESDASVSEPASAVNDEIDEQEEENAELPKNPFVDDEASEVSEGEESEVDDEEAEIRSDGTDDESDAIDSDHRQAFDSSIELVNAIARRISPPRKRRKIIVSDEESD